MNRLVIGIGNGYRRDDAVGLAVADAVAGLGLPHVDVLTLAGEPTALLDVWTGTPLTVVVDAATGAAATPGRLRRWTPGGGPGPELVSSHGLGLEQALALGTVLRRLPRRLVVFAVEIADARPGVGLTPAVAAAVPDVTAAIAAELSLPR